MSKEKDAEEIDIFQLLVAASDKKRKRERQELLKELKVAEFFVDGQITINKQTCRGVECKLCIDVCPTYALYWVKGEIGIEESLCVYCMACVLSCIVDDCISITRRRLNGVKETFSTAKQVKDIAHKINVNNRIERIRSICQDQDDVERFSREVSFKLKKLKGPD